MQCFCSHVIELKKGTLLPLGISVESDWAVVDLGMDQRGLQNMEHFFPC